jgi:Fe-S-cluster containining protein
VPLVELKFRLDAPDRFIEASVNLPREALRPVELLPVLLPLASAVTGMSESRTIENGETVSCRAGCGACCRQLVPVSELEALHLAALVEAMPEPRRSTVKERFREARERSAPVLEKFHTLAGEPAVEEIGKASEPYFWLGIPCPFLEEESCGIHEQRPSICREYLVVSSPEHCARLDAERIKRIPVPVTVSSALMNFSDGRGTDEPRVYPLIDALDRAAHCPEDAQPRIPAPEMFRNFMKQFKARSDASPTSTSSRKQ